MTAADSRLWRPMHKSLKSVEYGRFIALLAATRKAANVRQESLAKKLGKPQSFIAKYEGGERRIDVAEFIAICRALNADPVKLLRSFISDTVPTGPRSKFKK